MTRSESCALDTPSLSGRRISAVLELPKLCAEYSPRPSLSIAPRTRLKSTACSYATSITVPPRKSTPRFNPRVARNNTAARNVISEMTLNTSACRMNGMSRVNLKNSIVFPYVIPGTARELVLTSCLRRHRGTIGPPNLADRDLFELLAATVNQRHDAARYEDRGEHR